jgi:eukaryotic-like serine/threonine-protein kinase
MADGDDLTFPQSLPFSQAVRVDEACDRFEAAWWAGREPKIEDFLGDLAEPARSMLIHKLRALEQALRRPWDGSAQEMLRARAAGRHETTAPLSTAADAEIVPGDRTASPRAMVARPASASGPRFRVLRPHARGGLGEVFVARDEELNREVALKEIQARHASNQDSLARFLLEAEITGGLEHPGIVPVYSLGRHADDRPFYVMKFIRGETLKDAIERFHQAGATDERERGVEFRKLLTRFLDVCNTVAYAHSRGILHRDLKPSNILLGTFGETLVVDWGLAKPVGLAGERAGTAGPASWPASSSGSAETQPGTMMGTPQYMSPEQSSGRLDLIGPASDVYNLGATLYCLLTGRPPFDSTFAGVVITKVQEGDFPPLRAVNQSVPPPLEAICLKAMALRPEDRYPTPRALADDIEHLLADEPVSVYREPPAVRLARWGRRHRPVVAGLAALLVTAVVALSVSTILIGRETARKEKQRQLAELNFTRARNAVDQMLTEVAEVELADVPQMQAVRKRLLEKARGFYLDFLRHYADPTVRREAGRAHIRLGEIEELLGNHAAAERTYRRGIELLQALVAKSPAWADARRDQARGEHDLGVLLKKANRFRESETVLRAALDRRERLALKHPDDSGDRQALADSRYHLGALVARLRGRRAEQESAYRTALRLQEALVAASRDRPESRRKLARYLNNLAILLKDTGRTREAEDNWREAVKIQRGSAAGPFASPGDRWQLARSLSNLAVLLKETERPDEAETMSLEAEKLQSGLVTDFPDVPDYRHDLASIQNNLGLLWTSQRRDAAVLAFRAALTLREALVADFPGVPDYRQKLAVTRLNLAGVLEEIDPPRAWESYKEALAAHEQLVTAFPDVPEYQVALGRTLYSLARLQIVRDDLDGARASLGRAIGYHRAALGSDPRDRTCREFLRDDQGVLCLALIRSGAYEQAADSAEELTRIMPAAAAEWLRAAIFLAECASAAPDERSKNAFARRAVTLLRRAAERRLLKDPEALQVEELDPLRSRADFQKLRDDLSNWAKVRPG